MAEERKVVSVLFCDLVGFTAASEAADPEDIRGWLTPYHELLKATVGRFGGTVEKFAGDAILAVFGAPKAHEDDAERAVRAGLAIIDELTQLATPLQVRIGIDTGEALVALDARPEAGEAFVTGLVVNHAARLQSAAPVGAVVVGEGTYRATARVFGYEPLEPVSVKGISTPLTRWRAGAPRARLGVDVIRNLTTPLVGRVRDFTLLRTSFDKAVAERSVQIVTLIGEPGIGKSRLVAELGADLDRGEDLVTWREGRCLPYGEGPFWPLAEIFKAHAGILDTDRTDEVAAKLDAVLPGGSDQAWLRARVLPLLGLESGPTADPTGREESFAAWRELLESFAETQPAVVVLEDLHWADDALLAFVEYLVEWASDLPLLVVATARPELLERHPGWTGGRSNALTIGLSRLSDDETSELLSVWLPEVPAGTRSRLLYRAGGNPLYAEELARMLRDSGGRLPGGELPDGIAALIAARLDTLEPDRKSVLADASVVGRVFWAEAVAEMSGRNADEVGSLLHELARKELVRPVRQSSMEGRREYNFWHVLVRDVAYGQIPRAVRAVRHVAAADWIEDQCVARLIDAADILVYHLGTALDLARVTGDSATATELAPRVRRYAQLAAERAMNLDATQAMTLLDRALALTPDDDPARPEVLAAWAWAAFLTGQLDRSLDAYRQAAAGFEATGDVRGLAEALRLSAYPMSNLQESLATVDRAIGLLEPLGPSRGLIDALAGQAGIRAVAGRSEEAIEAADRALRLATEHDLPVPHRALEQRGLARVSRGDSGGLVDIKEALAALKDAGSGRDAAVTWLNYGIALWQIEGPVAALTTLEEAREFTTRRRLAELDQLLRGTVLQPTIEVGDLATAEADCRAQLASAGPAFTTLRRVEVLAALARVQLERGAAEAADCAEEAYALAVPEGWPDFIVIAAAPVASTRAAAGDRDGVRAVLGTLAGLTEVSNSQELPSRLPALVRAAIAAGDPDLGSALVERLQPLLPIREYASATSLALLAESRGDLAAAAAGFAEVAASWSAFGNRLEQAYALLGLARTDPDRAQTALAEAHTLFTTMGAHPSPLWTPRPT